MTNLFINTNQLFDIRDQYLEAYFFVSGSKHQLPIYLKEKLIETQITQNTIIGIKGDFKEEFKPYKTYFQNAMVTPVPKNSFWESFLTNYFLSFNVTVRIDEYTDSFTIKTCAENHYVWSNLSKDKKTIYKIEFGRYLPLKENYLGKESSWVKGVFTNTNDCHINFLQASFDGETSAKYQLNYSTENESELKNFLRIPFIDGWVEYDYRLGVGGFYKSSACINVVGIKKEFQFVLLSLGEQDIPFLTDRLSQNLRLLWADSFINKHKRYVDKTEVKPISHYIKKA